MNSYPSGSLVRLAVKFRSRNPDQTPGPLYDPAVVLFSWRDPNGTTGSASPPDVSNPMEGIYFYDLLVDVVGLWRYRIEGDGSVYESLLEVTPSVF
jgi:hypothetical protein